MITVDLDGVKVQVRPLAIQSFIEKIDYIKSRRPSPYSALRDLPDDVDAAGKAKFVEIAMRASMQLSYVGFEEELYFDASFEGRYYRIWQAVKHQFKWSKDPIKGVEEAQRWFNNLSKEDSDKLLMAIRGVEERTLAKNSDGPEENPPKGPDQT